MTADGVNGHLVGIRGWSLRGRSSAPLRLGSLILRYEWDGPVQRTGKPILDSHHFLPPTRPRPEVGFYACKPRFAYERLHRYGTLECVGVVSLFGRVVEHEYGYRAERVRVDALWVARGALPRRWQEETPRIADRLAERYRCDAGARRTVRDALEAARGFVVGSPEGTRVEEGTRSGRSTDGG